MDEVIVNANQLENSAESSAARLNATGLPYSVDPVLWRFQVPAWWRNGKGETKRNYRRLAALYSESTGVALAAGPIAEVVTRNEDWRRIAENVVSYQEKRLVEIPTQIGMFSDTEPRDLHPARVIAPALVAYSRKEDGVNAVLLDASLRTARAPVAAQVIIPVERLADDVEVDRILKSVALDGVVAYQLWTPGLSEDDLLAYPDYMTSLMRTVATLSQRGVVAHQYANYSVFALRDVGLSAVAHHLGWVDKGEPAAEAGFMIRSCQTYVPGVRRTLRFGPAGDLGRPLSPAEFAARYCECSFCIGAFESNENPLDLLLEDHEIMIGNATRKTPTSRAVGANSWHFLLSRRLEVESFDRYAAMDVVRRDMDRAKELSGRGATERLRRLMDDLRTA